MERKKTNQHDVDNIFHVPEKEVDSSYKKLPKDHLDMVKRKAQRQAEAKDFLEFVIINIWKPIFSTFSIFYRDLKNAENKNNKESKK